MTYMPRCPHCGDTTRRSRQKYICRGCGVVVETCCEGSPPSGVADAGAAAFVHAYTAAQGKCDAETLKESEEESISEAFRTLAEDYAKLKGVRSVVSGPRPEYRDGPERGKVMPFGSPDHVIDWRTMNPVRRCDARDADGNELPLYTFFINLKTGMVCFYLGEEIDGKHYYHEVGSSPDFECRTFQTPITLRWHDVEESTGQTGSVAGSSEAKRSGKVRVHGNPQAGL